MLGLKENDRFSLRGVTDRIKKMQQAIVGYFVSRDEDNRRVLPRMMTPNYHVQPVSLRHHPRFRRSPNKPRRRRRAITQSIGSHHLGFY